jgi:hypothetical protein
LHPVEVVRRDGDEADIVTVASEVDELHRKVSSTFAARDGSEAADQAWEAAADQFRAAAQRFVNGPYFDVAAGHSVRQRSELRQ